MAGGDLGGVVSDEYCRAATPAPPPPTPADAEVSGTMKVPASPLPPLPPGTCASGQWSSALGGGSVAGRPANAESSSTSGGGPSSLGDTAADDVVVGVAALMTPAADRSLAPPAPADAASEPSVSSASSSPLPRGVGSASKNPAGTPGCGRVGTPVDGGSVDRVPPIEAAMAVGTGNAGAFTPPAAAALAPPGAAPRDAVGSAPAATPPPPPSALLPPPSGSRGGPGGGGGGGDSSAGGEGI